MRLEQDVQPARRTAARRGQGGPDFGRVVAVVVDHGDAALYAFHLEAPIDAAELRQSFADRATLDVQFEGRGDSCRRIQHVVLARHVQLEGTQIVRAVPEIEGARGCPAPKIRNFEVRLSRAAVSDGAPLDLRQDLLHVLVVQAEERGAVKRDFVHKLRKGFADFFDIRVMVEMLAIDVGHDGEDRRKLQE